MPADQGRLRVPEALLTFRRWSSKQQRGARLPAYWSDILKRDPTGASIVMVFEVIIGSSRYRFATEPLGSISGSDGSDHGVQQVTIQEPSIKHGYKLGDGTSAARSVQIVVNAESIDPATLIRNGVVLAGYGEVALEVRRWPEGDHDRRYVIIQGELAGGVRFGGVRGVGEGEVIDLEIVDPKASMDSRLPLWVVDTDRFSTALHPTAVGTRIPMVYNGSNAIPAVRTDDVPGARRFMFAHRHGWDTANAITYVNGIAVAPGNLLYGHSFVELYDDGGVPYTAVNFSNAATVWADGDSVHVTVDHTDELLTVVQVIQDICLNHTPLGEGGISPVLFTAADAKVGTAIPRVLINGASGSSGSNALQWIESGLIDEFPMLSMVWGPSGYGPIVTDRRAAPVMKLVMGQPPLIDRTSLMQETPKEELFNEWVIRYDYDPLLDSYQKVKTLNPTNNAVCEFSRDRLGHRYAPVIESVYITSDSVADLVLNWRVEHQTLPSYLVEYACFASVFLTLRRGDTVQLTDQDFNWVDVQATVEFITYQRGRVMLGLRVWVQFVKLGGTAVTFQPPDL